MRLEATILARQEVQTGTGGRSRCSDTNKDKEKGRGMDRDWHKLGVIKMPMHSMVFVAVVFPLFSPSPFWNMMSANG